jgi:hypothetical protein
VIDSMDVSLWTDSGRLDWEESRVIWNKRDSEKKYKSMREHKRTRRHKKEKKNYRNAWGQKERTPLEKGSADHTNVLEKPIKRLNYSWTLVAQRSVVLLSKTAWWG